MSNNDFTNDIKMKLQAFINEQQKNGHTPTMEELNYYLGILAEKQNLAPNEQFSGFSSEQMYHLVNFPFDEKCPVQIRTLTHDEIEEIPFMKQALHLMHLLEPKELKLTVQGYIPPQIVTDLYEMGMKNWYADMYKQKLEPRVKVVQVLRVVLNQCGLIKVRLGKMSLTAKGRKVLNDENALLHILMQFMFYGYNTGWLDEYPDMEVANVGRLYSLWLLHHYGDVWRSQGFYFEKYLKAFPKMEFSRAYEGRTFSRLFYFIGLCEFNDSDNCLDWDKRTRKRDILDKVFSFVEPGTNK